MMCTTIDRAAGWLVRTPAAGLVPIVVAVASLLAGTPHVLAQGAGGTPPPAAARDFDQRLDATLGAMAGGVTGPRNPQGDLLDPNGNAVAPTTVQGLVLVREVYTAQLEGFAAGLDETRNGLSRGEKVELARELGRHARDLESARVNLVHAQRDANDLYGRQKLLHDARLREADRLARAGDTAGAAAARADAARSAYGVFLQRRADLFRALDQHPVLGVKKDGTPLYTALIEAEDRVSASGTGLFDEPRTPIQVQQVYVDLLNAHLEAGSAEARTLASQARQTNGIEELLAFGGARYGRQHASASAVGSGLAADLVEEARLVQTAVETTRAENEAFTDTAISLGLGVVAAGSILIPVVGPAIAAGVSAIEVARDGADVAVAYRDVDDAERTAAVTGYTHVIDAQDRASDAEDQLAFTVVLAVPDAVGVRSALRNVRAARATTGASDEAAGAAARAGRTGAADELADTRIEPPPTGAADELADTRIERPVTGTADELADTRLEPPPGAAGERTAIETSPPGAEARRPGTVREGDTVIDRPRTDGNRALPSAGDTERLSDPDLPSTARPAPAAARPAGGRPVTGGLSPNEIESLVGRVPEGLRPFFRDSVLGEVDEVVRRARARGVDEADIEAGLARLRPDSGLDTAWRDASHRLEQELVVADANRRGLTVLLDPQEVDEFRRWSPGVMPSSSLEADVNAILDVKIKVELESAGRPQTWTPEELRLLQEDLIPQQNVLERWRIFEPDEGGLIPIFDEEWVAKARRVLDADAETMIARAPRAATERATTEATDQLAEGVEREVRRGVREAVRQGDSLPEPDDERSDPREIAGPEAAPEAAGSGETGESPAPPPDEAPSPFPPVGPPPPLPAADAPGPTPTGGGGGAADAGAMVAPGGEGFMLTIPPIEFTMDPILPSAGATDSYVDVRELDAVALPEFFGGPGLGGDADPTTQKMILLIEPGGLEIAPVPVPASQAPGLPLAVRSLWQALQRLARSMVEPAWTAEARTPVRYGADGSRDRWIASAGLQPQENSPQGDGPGRVRLYLTSLGRSSGEAFQMHVLNDMRLPIRLTGDGIVIEPLKKEAQRHVQEQMQKQLARVAGRNVVTARLNAYCLEFIRQPPSAGMLFRIADSEVQAQFAPMRRIVQASRTLQEAGLLSPDSDPTSYLHFTRQWALWTREQGFDLRSFGDAFIDHTKKAFGEAGQRWSSQVEQALRQAIPGRWRDVVRILEEADRQARSATARDQ